MLDRTKHQHHLGKYHLTFSIKTSISKSNLVLTKRFWNNLHPLDRLRQIRKPVKLFNILGWQVNQMAKQNDQHRGRLHVSKED